MIPDSRLTLIGRILKTHGLRGELSVGLDIDTDDFDALTHIVMPVDGINVPFRIMSRRPRGAASELITLIDMDSADAAAPYVGSDVYALDEQLPEGASGEEDEAEGFYAEDLAGWMLGDAAGKTLGRIEAVDTTTINTLLHVGSDDGRSVLIPLVDEWITGIDAENRVICMDIPKELLEL